MEQSENRGQFLGRTKPHERPSKSYLTFAFTTEEGQR